MQQALVRLTGPRQRLQSNYGVHVAKSERRARTLPSSDVEASSALESLSVKTQDKRLNPSPGS
jgi:hypothetical protein